MAAERYHHGNLHSALLDAALEMSRVTGADALSLRAVTRRVGVSSRAAYRHFANRDDLIRAVAVVGLAAMARTIEDELVEAHTPVERLGGVGRGYLRFALDEPGWFDVALLTTRGFELFQEPGAQGDSGLTPHGLLTRALRDLADDGALDPADVDRAAMVCWSGVHGLATLVARGPLSTVPAETAREMAGALAADLVHALTVGGVAGANPRMPHPPEPLTGPVSQVSDAGDR